MKIIIYISTYTVFFLLGLPILVLLNGCEEKHAYQEALLPATFYDTNQLPSTRFRLERIAVVQDDIAYNSQRGIYILHDNQHTTQYIGVSGIGISVLGQHGKNVDDEQ